MRDIPDERRSALLGFSKRIGYEFADIALLDTALTHSSYAAQEGLRYSAGNERLEFLGDAFFDAIISEELFKRVSEGEEGRLTKLRAQVVCEASLAEAAEKLEIGEMLLFSRGEELTGGRRRESTRADAMEAVIAAVFLDGGYAAAKELTLRIFGGMIDEALAGKRFSDYKTAFQERVQARDAGKIEYRLVRSTGPDHDKTFFVELFLDERGLSKGSGKSKKEAEQRAAKAALEAGF